MTPEPLPTPPKRRGRILLVMVAVLAAAAAVFHFLMPRPARPPVVRVYTPAQAAIAQKHIDALRDQVLHPAEVAPPAALQTAPATHAAPTTIRSVRRAPPRPRLVRLQISEADLNTYLASNPDAQRLLLSRGVKAVQVLLRQPHDIDVRAAVLYHGSPANVELQGTLEASPDTICRFTATHAQVGRLPIPAGTVTAQADRIAAQLAGRYHGRLPLTVQDVQVINDSLVIIGTPRRTASR